MRGGVSEINVEKFGRSRVRLQILVGSSAKPLSLAELKEAVSSIWLAKFRRSDSSTPKTEESGVALRNNHGTQLEEYQFDMLPS